MEYIDIFHVFLLGFDMGFVVFIVKISVIKNYEMIDMILDDYLFGVVWVQLYSMYVIVQMVDGIVIVD